MVEYVYKTIDILLYPDEDQVQLLQQHCEDVTTIKNVLRDMLIQESQKTRFINFGYHRLCKLITELKRTKEYKYLQRTNSQSLQQAAKQLSNAFERYVADKRTVKGRAKKIERAERLLETRSFTEEVMNDARQHGFPKPKEVDDTHRSFVVPQHFTITENQVEIPKIGRVRWNQYRPIPGDPRQLIIKRDLNRWYCKVKYRMVTTGTLPTPTSDNKANFVGIDFGLTHFAVLSDDTTIVIPKSVHRISQRLWKIRRKQHQLAPSASEKEHLKKKIQKLTRKRENVVRDFLHQETSRLVKDYWGFAVENLNKEAMMKQHRDAGHRSLARRIQKIFWGRFISMLENKCRENYKHLIKVPTNFPSSQLCSKCDHQQAMPLGKNPFHCSECGVTIERDYNAAINIKEKGWKILIESWDGTLPRGYAGTATVLKRSQPEYDICIPQYHKTACGDAC